MESILICETQLARRLENGWIDKFLDSDTLEYPAQDGIYGNRSKVSMFSDDALDFED